MLFISDYMNISLTEYLKPLYNFDKLTGKTITVYTSSGGLSGIGFTGVLIFSNDTFITLLSTPNLSTTSKYIGKAKQNSFQTVKTDIIINAITAVTYSNL